MVAHNRYSKAVRIIEDSFEPYFWSKNLTPFEVLVSTILSQKTERRGTRSAFERLKTRIGITPDALADADVSAISDAIQPAGLYRSKAATLKEISRLIRDGYGGDISSILDLPTGEARKRLLDLPGVGPKTADIFLGFVAGRPVFAVDVHIERVAKRIGLVSEKAGYDEIKAAFESIIPPKNRARTHMALIEFGREICIARHPKHELCPISQYCDYYQRSVVKSTHP